MGCKLIGSHWTYPQHLFLELGPQLQEICSWSLNRMRTSSQGWMMLCSQPATSKIFWVGPQRFYEPISQLPLVKCSFSLDDMHRTMLKCDIYMSWHWKYYELAMRYDATSSCSSYMLTGMSICWISGGDCTWIPALPGYAWIICHDS